MRRSTRYSRPGLSGSSKSATLLGADGDGSTLTLDFTTGQLDPRLTFTRNGGGTYIGNNGLVYGMDFATSSSLAIGTGSKSVTLTATAGVDRRYLVGQTVYISNGANNMSGPVTAYNASTQVLTINATATSGSGSFTSWAVGNASPRFDYDPTTLAPRGLLIEGTATNLALYSQSFTSGISWFFGGTGTKSTTNNYATAPDGTTTAARLQLGLNCALKQIAGTTGVNHTVSIWVKSNTGSNQTIAFWTGTAAANRTATTSWTRIEAVVNNASAALFDLYNPNASDCDILIWGAQLETGSGASSYIPTGASTATRNRDQVALTNLSSINFSQTEGTCLATVEVREKADSTFLPYGSFDTSGGGRCWWWLRHNLSTSTGTRLLGNAFNSGGSTALTTANYVYNSGNGGVVKFATSLDTAASSMVFSIAGGSPQTTTAAAFTLATAAQWGLNTSTDVTATDLGSMWVQSFKYWPTALPNAQLQSLTL